MIFVNPNVLERFLHVLKAGVGEKAEHIEIQQRLDGVERPIENSCEKCEDLKVLRNLQVRRHSDVVAARQRQIFQLLQRRQRLNADGSEKIAVGDVQLDKIHASLGNYFDI